VKDGAFPRLKTLLPVLGLYLVLAVVFTWPAASLLTTHVPGEFCSDLWKKLWGNAFVESGLLREHAFPLRTDLINYPSGGALFITDPLNAAITFVLHRFIPGIAACRNALILFHLLLASTGCWLLAFHLTRSAAVSFLAGAIFAFSPYVLSYCIESEVSECLNIGWIPLAILFFLRTLEDGRWRHAAAAGLFLALAALGTWYYGVFVALFLVLLVPHVLTWGVSLSPAPSGRLTRGRVLRVLAAVALAALLVLPAAAAFRRCASSPDSIFRADKIQLRSLDNISTYLGANFHDAAFLADYFRPGKGNLGVKRSVDTLTYSSYLGYVPLLLALAALGRRRAPLAAFLWGLLLLFLVLSLGPFFFVTRDLHLSFPGNLPYMLLYWIFPFFSTLGVPYRFYAMVSLALALLAALGALRLIEKFKWSPPLAAAALCALVVVETLAVSPVRYPMAVTPTAVPAYCGEIGREEGRFAVLDLPVMYREGPEWPSVYFHYQTAHGKPIPYTVPDWLGPLPRFFRENALLYSLYLEEDGMRRGVSRAPAEGELSAAARQIRDVGVRYIVFHEDFYTDRCRGPAYRRIREHFGEPRRLDAVTLLFTVKGSGKSWRQCL